MAPTDRKGSRESEAAYPSLAALRQRHAELLQLAPTDGLRGDDLLQVAEFLRRGAATGTVLDQLADRETAQGLLDYWKATLYTERRHKQSSPRQTDDAVEKVRLPAAVLADFDPATLRTATATADRWLETLSPADRKVARRIMLRLVRLANDKHAFEPVPSSRAALHELDYVLIRLAEPLGAKPWAMNPDSEGSAPARGWVRVPDESPAFKSPMGVLIAQHPAGWPLKLAVDTEAINQANQHWLNGNGTRVRYATNTLGGSSGSPVFDLEWNLIALHHYGDPSYNHTAKYNQGVPIGQIRDRLRRLRKEASLGGD